MAEASAGAFQTVVTTFAPEEVVMYPRALPTWYVLAVVTFGST